MSAKASFRNDPLCALGPSLFLLILSHVPFPTLLTAELVSRSWRSVIHTHEKGVWRSVCHRTGVERKHMRMMASFERAFSVPSTLTWYGEPGEEEPMPPNEGPAGSIKWRDMCKYHVGLQRNWRFGRCREKWITPPGNTAWRIKVDSEQETMLLSSRIGTHVLSSSRAMC